MIIRIDMSSLADNKAHQYALRFALGGLATVIAGGISEKFGPSVGGLFLTFPVIFPASVTLVDLHLREKKERKGQNGVARARQAAACDAAGAALGSLGLAAFGMAIWLGANRMHTAALFAVAAAAWITVSVTAWRIRKIV